MSKSVKGYILGILAAVFYGLIPLFTIPLYNDGMHSYSVLFWRYILAIPMMALLMNVNNVAFAIKTFKELVLLITAGFLVGISSVTLFESYNYMDVGIASTLLFLYPVIVAIIMSIFFKERLKLYSWICLIGAFIGICLLSKSESGAYISFIGALLSFGSSLSYAIYIVAANKTAIKNIPSTKVIFYVLTFGLIVFMVPLSLNGTIEVPQNLIGWGNVLGLALFPTAGSFWLITISIKCIGPTNSAILGAFEPVTGVAVSLLALGGVLSIRESIGVVMVLGFVTLLTAGPKLMQLKKGTWKTNS